jgi:hypothetical protein
MSISPDDKNIIYKIIKFLKLYKNKTIKFFFFLNNKEKNKNQDFLIFFIYI